jgi:hypothetical protein
MKSPIGVRPEWCYFKLFQRQNLKPFTEGREGRKGSTTAAGGAHRSAEREGGFFPLPAAGQVYHAARVASCPLRPSVKFLTVP